MFIVPGNVVGWLTFPGVIVHELAHQLFCRLFKVPVYEVVYFRTTNPLGYVLHEPTRSDTQSIFISIGPFIINTLLGFIIGFPVAILQKFNAAGPLDYLLIYFAVSIAMHAFPSTGDAQSLWASVNNKEKSLLSRVIVAPIVGFIYVGALGSVVMLDAAYGVAVALGLPWLIIQWLS